MLTCRPQICGQSPIAPKNDQDNLHGGIEIDSDGIKAAVIRISGAGGGTQIVYTDATNTLLKQTTGGKLSPEAVKETTQIVLDYYTRLREQYGVPSKQVSIVSGSDLKAENLEELTGEIKRSTGKDLAFLSLESEVRLSIIGTIPLRYREETFWYNNRNQSMWIDVGSHKIKGGYQQIRQPLTGTPYYDFVALGVPKGLTVLTDEVNSAVGENAEVRRFALNAKQLCDGSIKSALKNELETKPGLEYRKRIYLTGSIVWALTTLMHPEERQSFIPITVEDINLFHQRAINSPRGLLNPSLTQIRDEETRRQVDRDLKAVRSYFTIKSLIAGAELLKAVAGEYGFQDPGKSLLFPRFGHLSVILSYVRLQAENGPQP
ncbi:MAG TPA: hypothetical protein VJ302_20155 [Blastocatellia bacterium]|nr:hypothetical protein [Blastocatellia bacterium]